jgi:hypothetical protein
MYKIEIACVDMLQEYAGQVHIWLWFVDRVIPLELRKKREIFSFRLLSQQ